MSQYEIPVRSPVAGRKHKPPDGAVLSSNHYTDAMSVKSNISNVYDVLSDRQHAPPLPTRKANTPASPLPRRQERLPPIPQESEETELARQNTQQRNGIPKAKEKPTETIEVNLYNELPLDSPTAVGNNCDDTKVTKPDVYEELPEYINKTAKPSIDNSVKNQHSPENPPAPPSSTDNTAENNDKKSTLEKLDKLNTKLPANKEKVYQTNGRTASPKLSPTMRVFCFSALFLSFGLLIGISVTLVIMLTVLHLKNDHMAVVQFDTNKRCDENAGELPATTSGPRTSALTTNTIGMTMATTMANSSTSTTIPSSAGTTQGNRGGETIGGVVYTIWGRSECPQNASHIYTGYTSGGSSQASGGPTNNLCLPEVPTWYPDYESGNDTRTFLYRTEYVEMDDTRQEQTLPCSVCRAPGKYFHMMVPARVDCFGGWDMEYSGFLMGNSPVDNKGRALICVDIENRFFTNISTNEGESLLYKVEVKDGNETFPRYHVGRELTCAVCTQ